MHSQSLPWYKLNGHDALGTIQLNPAFQLNDKLVSTVQISTISLDYQNNFGYFKDKSFTNLIFNLSDISIPELQYRKSGYNPVTGLGRDVTGFEMKFNENALNRMYFNTSFSYGGPGYVRKLKNGFHVGIFSGVEFQGGVNDFPISTTYPVYKNYREGNSITVPIWNAAAYSYFHIGLHGSKEFQLSDNERFSIGLNAKYLGGLMYMSLNNKESVIDYTFGKDEDIQISNLMLDYSYTHSDENDIADPFIKGHGIGADLGVYYSRKISNRQISFVKGGVSVSNLGTIKFNTSLRKGSFEVNGPTGINFVNFDTIQSLDQFIDSAIVLSDQNELNVHKEVLGGTIYLPAELNFMFSTGFREYAKLNFLYSMPLSRLSPKTFQIGFVPELILNKINILVPFSYNQFTGFRLGAGVNVDFLTIGTDDIRSLFKRDKLESGSIYLGINILKFEKKDKVR